MAVDHRSISIQTTTSNRARLDPCRAVHPPANRVRPAQRRPLYPATNQAARAMRKADYARKQVICAVERPTEHPSAPAIRVQKDQASDSASTAATGDTPRKRDWPTPPDRTPLRAIRHAQEPQQTNPRENAAKYSAHCSSSRMILPQPSRPNAMLSRRRTIAVGRADW